MFINNGHNSQSFQAEYWHTSQYHAVNLDEEITLFPCIRSYHSQECHSAAKMTVFASESLFADIEHFDIVFTTL